VTDPRPRRAAIVGYIGFGNLGDELILAGIERLLAGLPIEVTTLFGGPALDQTVAFPGAIRRTPWRHLPTPRAARDLRRADLLIVGGGGLINDHWPLVIPRYLAWVLVARMVGTPVTWIGVGVGPIRRRAWRWMARLAARLSGPVVVRDEGSAALLGGASGRVRIMPDPALFLEPSAPGRLAPAGPGPTMGLIVREPVHGREPDVVVLLELLARFAAAGRASGLRPRLMLMDPAADRAFARRVADRLARDGECPPSGALGPTTARARQQLGELGVVVSVRLHGLLLSAVSGVPCVPIAYDAKVAAAAERIGLGDVVIPPSDVGDDAVARALAAVKDPDRVRQVAARVADLREQADAVRQLLT
jgi:polysaccharide pyruvyl transferase WcaK-like protein